jgi:hypothetical protein
VRQILISSEKIMDRRANIEAVEFDEAPEAAEPAQPDLLS